MFTGIITHTGKVAHIEKSGDWLITIAAPNFTGKLAIGASVACSGTCLTAIAKNKSDFTVQVSKETISKTTIGSWKKGTVINLERALKVGDELGGHFVSGHVDGLARLKKKEKIADSWKLTFGVPISLSTFIAAKGSVTLDGVSLTVNSVAGTVFSVNIIPHTFNVTTFGKLEVGGTVNCEIDLIARYLARQKSK
jgi:riboflavin synthase